MRFGGIGGCRETGRYRGTGRDIRRGVLGWQLVCVNEQLLKKKKPSILQIHTIPLQLHRYTVTLKFKSAS